MKQPKLTKEQKVRLYLELYKEADELLKLHNPCKVDSKGMCARNMNCCCYGCPYLSPTGCTVKSLPCKLWLCNHLWYTGAASEELREKLKAMFIIADYFGFNRSRGSMADNLLTGERYNAHTWRMNECHW